MSSPADTHDPAAQGPAAVFAGLYQDAVGRWPVPVTSLSVDTGYGLTHLLASGPPDAPALLLLPAGGATAVVWRPVAGGLSRCHRIIAVDPIGQPGLSTPGGSPLRTVADLAGWIDQLLDGLGLSRAVLVGHSYGAWMALRYALHAPHRVGRLILLDPTDCFAPLSLSYRLHALPLLARPSAGRMRRFLAWETRGRPLDPVWLSVAAAGQNLGRAKIVLPRVPARSELAGLRLPVLVMVAGQSRAHDPGLIARRAHDRLPEATTVTLPTASHHSIPAEDTEQILGHIGSG